MNMKIIKLTVFPMLFLLWSIFGNPQAASAQNFHAFAYADIFNSAIGVPYTPDPTYSYNPQGPITITRNGTGLYTVIFYGLGALGTGMTGPGMGGHVQVSSYNMAMSNKYIAKIMSWSSLGNDFIVDVRTQQASFFGTAGNSYFNVFVVTP